MTDEIYEHILYDGAKHISMASLPGMRDQTITVNSISKTYSLTGWRVGWAVAPPTITNALNPFSRSRCATRALVASRAQVQ